MHDYFPQLGPKFPKNVYTFTITFASCTNWLRGTSVEDSFAIFPQFFKVILSGQDAQHVVLPLEGGSDNGEFPIVGQKLKSYKVSLKSGKLHEGDVIVEVQVYMGSSPKCLPFATVRG